MTDVFDFCHHVASIKAPNGTQRIPNIVDIVQYVLTLAFSKTVVDRFFLALKNVKTDHRNWLKSVTLTSIIQAKSGMKRKKHVSQDLEVDTPLLKRLRSVKTNATPDECTQSSPIAALI